LHELGRILYNDYQFYSLRKSSFLAKKGRRCEGESDKSHRLFLWKQKTGETIEPEEPLMISSNTGGHLTTRAIQKVFKRCAEKGCLNSSYSIHRLHHTYACLLLKASDWNLRLVQKQLSHARISTIQVYADVMMPDIKKALDRLYI
jgi:site-specific recombinase XerC